jgi:hypothetical protein
VLGTALDLHEDTVSSDSAEIVGRFSVSSSERSTIALRPSAAGEVCVAGNLALVMDDDWETYWGSQLSMSLNEAPDATASPWQRRDVIGFAFDVVGAVPPELRFVASAPEGDLPAQTYCVVMFTRPEGTRFAHFDEMRTACWDELGGNALAGDPLLQLGWHLPASSSFQFEFDFCVSNVRPIRATE